MYKVKITVFDDGNQKYQDFENKWIIIDTMYNYSKYKLQNIKNKNIVINSISSWKTSIIN